jgi:biotin transport system substrate-specific component
MAAVTTTFSPTRTDIISSRKSRFLLATGTLTVLMALGAVARIHLPFTPVPFTLQTFFLFFGAMALGKRSTSSIGAYIGIGALGLPVFAGFAGGLSILTGITAGYLLGFVFCAYIVGSLISKSEKSSPARDAAILALAMLSYYIPGVLWLKIATGISFKAAILAGFVPFIIMDAAKAALALSLYKIGKKRISELF